MSCRIFRKIGLVVWPVHRAITDRQTDKQTNRWKGLRECILCKIGLTDWVIYLVDWQWQRSRTRSLVLMTQMKSVQWVSIIWDQYCCNTENTWPWPFTFDLDLFPWPLTLIFDLETDLLLPWCFEENITKMYCFDVTWRKNGTSYVRTETNLRGILSVNILHPTRSLYDFRFQSYKRWFSWFLMCLTLTLTFQGHLIFVNSPFVPLHDWCKSVSDIFINSCKNSTLKLPILYNGNFRCHGNVCYVFRINDFR